MKISKRGKRRAYRKTGGPRYFGNNCKSYERGCMVCEAYRFYATRGRFPALPEVVRIMLDQRKD